MIPYLRLVKNNKPVSGEDVIVNYKGAFGLATGNNIKNSYYLYMLDMDISDNTLRIGNYCLSNKHIPYRIVSNNVLLLNPETNKYKVLQSVNTIITKTDNYKIIRTNNPNILVRKFSKSFIDSFIKDLNSID